MSGVGVSGELTGTTTTFQQPEIVQEDNEDDTVEETVESPRSFPSSLPSSSSSNCCSIQCNGGMIDFS